MRSGYEALVEKRALEGLAGQVDVEALGVGTHRRQAAAVADHRSAQRQALSEQPADVDADGEDVRAAGGGHDRSGAFDDACEHASQSSAGDASARRATQETRRFGHGLQAQGVADLLRIGASEGPDCSSASQQQRRAEERDFVDEAGRQEGAEDFGAALDHHARDARARRAPRAHPGRSRSCPRPPPR